ncbi:CHY zinc finger protein [Alkalibacterium sp. f15]|uniref:CHY zinc finger protein n=1 Tax=Alkalibacterium sp. f15 TaxID=3414029 RepID=UPI003BF783EE
MKVKGFLIDHQTRCKHYHGEKDIVAIKFKCCGDYYPCYKCHDESVNHTKKRWSKEEFSKKAILCGECLTECNIEEYMAHQTCSHCAAHFNPDCRFHYDVYFEV